MKNLCITLLILTIITLSICLYAPKKQTNAKTDYLRIHVRANSNDECDQDVKYKVKNAVVEFLTPYVATCKTVDESKRVLGELLPKIERVCERVLKENGFSYGAQASICTEFFPTRVYDDLTLERGDYDALIINLGKGIGDNWWCVIYPPLCFSGGANVHYRSAILDVINSFFGR